MLPVCGARTVERAGALIAGSSDDADSLWLDPTGLAHLAGDGRTELLFDVAYVAQGADYTGIDRGGNRPRRGIEPAIGFIDPTIAATLGSAIGYDDDPQRYASVSLAARSSST